MSTSNDTNCPTGPRKLRPLVISLGGRRQQDILEMFAHPTMAAYFEAPSFSLGIPQRELRNQMSLLKHAGQAGILPDAEWAVLRQYYYDENSRYQEKENKAVGTASSTLLDTLLKDIPVEPGRMGSDFDKGIHYSKELWQKAKGINRGRSVLACALAHLVAMKKLVEEGYDFILEDNVRAPIYGSYDHSKCECAERIWSTLKASLDWENATGEKCHMRYYGWLGSRTNIDFVMTAHIPKTKYTNSSTQKQETVRLKDHGDYDSSFFPFPIQADIEEYLLSKQQDYSNREMKGNDNTVTNDKRNVPGGTPIWGAYSYWVSQEGYKAIITSLQKDVGALLWKGKRMRCYHVKPIDKIIPRRILEVFSRGESSHDYQEGRKYIHLATQPAFFRAPMLTSQIHRQWDAEFCKSSEYQMMLCSSQQLHNYADNGTLVKYCTPSYDDLERSQDADSKSVVKVLPWDKLWLTEDEKVVVEHRRYHNRWLTNKEINSMPNTDESDIKY